MDWEIFTASFAATLSLWAATLLVCLAKAIFKRFMR